MKSASSLVFSFALSSMLAFGLAASAHGQDASHDPDSEFADGFEGIAGGPATDADASRFLAQATFGATSADIAHLRDVGYRGWLDEQFGESASKQVPYLDWVAQLNCPPDDDSCNTVEEYASTRLEIWAINTVGTVDPSRSLSATNPPLDQLRQRVAFALSEIFVISANNGTLAYSQWTLSSFYDLLAKDAFVNYRTLLEDVTKHPAMGIYLSSIQNQKADPEQNIHPDENYAREVNQLFSVGLVELNLDGTPKLSGGNPIPTYDQETVRGFAAVFTGWNWNSEGCTIDYEDNVPLCCNNPNYPPQYFYCGPNDPADREWQLPMEPVEVYHDGVFDKQLLSYPGVALPGGILPGGSEQNPTLAQADLTAALDNVFNHPNVGPFIATRLIQRLVTSNPTPAYVQRVASVFNDDGGHVRGNLRAVIAAILLDPEARYGQWQHPETFGKLREPLLKTTQMWRAMDATSTSGRIDSLAPYPPVEEYLGQAPLRSPTVFNFFKPDFAQPGEVETSGLVSPEFQILTDTITVATPNYLFHLIYCYYTGSDRCYDSDDDETMQLDEDRDASLAESDPGALLDRYSILFMGGQMSPFMRDVLLTRLNALDPPGDQPLGRARVQEALYLIVNSPEYSIQK